MTAQPPADVLRDKIERITRALNDPDIEPAAFARLTLEAARMRDILARTTQSESERSAT